MHVRNAGIAVALLLAAACRTSGSQATGGTQTSSASEPSSERSQRGEATAGTQGSPSAPSRPGEDPLMLPGPDIKGHASDQVVSGAIGRVSPHEVAIVSDRGDLVVLDIVPETSIMIEGQDATHDELQEGQPVRASYNRVEGQDVAVEIRAVPGGSSSGAGTSGTGSSGAPESGSATGSGSSESPHGPHHPGSSGSTGTGSGDAAGSSGSGGAAGSSGSQQ